MHYIYIGNDFCVIDDKQPNSLNSLTQQLGDLCSY